MNKRVVVTGLGVISSIGQEIGDFWVNALAGMNGCAKVSSIDTSQYNSSIGGEIKNFNAQKFISEENLHFYGKTSQLAIAASKMALIDAKLTPSDLDEVGSSVIVGTTNGESNILEEIDFDWVTRGEDFVDPKKILKYPGNIIALNICKELKINADCYVIPTACAAGNYALGYGFDRIKSGLCTFSLSGGADAFSQIAYSGFNRMFAMANDKCRPFDKNRKGMIAGEGAAILLLEDYDHALSRGAKIYAEIAGYALSCDASHMTIPNLEGIVSVMTKALKQAGVSSESIDYISAHGTGTKMNDKIESASINIVFNNRRVAVSSMKSMIGHTMGAASAIESAVCCLAIFNSKIPPTINYEAPDDDCDIDCVPNKYREMKVRYAMNNSFAFGGNNACSIFKKST